jgi:flavin-binding protein dodecin
MGNHVYKQIVLTGTSKTSIEDAVNSALAKAAASVRNLRWFEITETRGHIENQKLSHWQVTMTVGFTLED